MTRAFESRLSRCVLIMTLALAACGAPAPNTVWLAFRYRSQPLQLCAASASMTRSWLSGTKFAAVFEVFKLQMF